MLTRGLAIAALSAGQMKWWSMLRSLKGTTQLQQVNDSQVQVKAGTKGDNIASIQFTQLKSISTFRSVSLSAVSSHFVYNALCQVFILSSVSVPSSSTLLEVSIKTQF